MPGITSYYNKMDAFVRKQIEMNESIVKSNELLTQIVLDLSKGKNESPKTRQKRTNSDN